MTQIKIKSLQQIKHEDIVFVKKEQFYMMLTYSNKLPAISVQINYQQFFELQSLGIPVEPIIDRKETIES